MASDNAKRRLAAIVCVDMAGYSALAETDEARAMAAVAALAAHTESVAKDHSGRVFNSAGDGFLLEFASANSALAAALAIINQPDAAAPPLRIGIHLGDVVVTGSGDLLGHAVNVAARLQGEAGENCIIVSKTVFDLVRGPDAARLVPIGVVDIDKTSADVEAFAFDPAGPRGSATGRRPRRRWILAVAAASVAAIALIVALWAVSVASASYQTMLGQVRGDVTRQVVSQGALNQESIDSAYLTVADLSQSTLSPERSAFTLLRDGQTLAAVDALETYAADLERQGARASAASAWTRAGALVQFSDAQRALTNFRRGFDLAPQSLEQLAGLLQATAATEGYAAALAITDETAASPNIELSAYANLYCSFLAGDLGDTDRQRRCIGAARPGETDNAYLRGLDKVARGYLAFQQLDLHQARALYQEGRADLAHIPGHERDHQQGWLLVLSAMGDFDGAWRDGRAFVTERNSAGAPPWAQMMITTCVAGLQVAQADLAGPYCRAGAAGVSGSIGEPSGELALAALTAEQGDLIAARAHLAAARASRWYGLMPSTAVQAAWIEGRILQAERDIDGLSALLARTMTRIRASSALAPRAAMFAALLEQRRADTYLALGQTGAACSALTRVAAAYEQIGGDQGAANAARSRRELECPPTQSE